jgi:hypothetical protein
MKSTARFYVQEVSRFAYGSGWAKPAPLVKVKLIVATRGEENKEWASATPQGEITMTIGNPEAAAWWDERLGKDISVTFEDRPDAELA